MATEASVFTWSLGTAIMLAILVIAFALLAARTAPHNVPLGVVAAPQQVAEIQKMATGFTVHTFASAEEATAAIKHREIYGALVLNNPTDLGVLDATAASPAVAAMIQGSGQHLAEAIHRTATLTDIRSFPDRDPNGVGLAAGALPLALGGWMGRHDRHAPGPRPAPPRDRRRVIAAVGVAVVGGLAVVATLQSIIGTFDGNFWLTSLAGMLGSHPISE